MKKENVEKIEKIFNELTEENKKLLVLLANTIKIGQENKK